MYTNTEARGRGIQLDCHACNLTTTTPETPRDLFLRTESHCCCVTDSRSRSSVLSNQLSESQELGEKKGFIQRWNSGEVEALLENLFLNSRRPES
jgi:hypothetical protein